MRKEIQSVLFFLVLQNVLYVFLIFLQYLTPLSQAIGSILIGGFVYLWLEHENKIRETITRIDMRNEEYEHIPKRTEQ